MRDLDRSVKRRHFACVDLVDSQQLQADARAHDIHYRVHRPNFVKMNLIDGLAVDLRLRLTEPLNTATDCPLTRSESPLASIIFLISVKLRPW